MFLPFLLSADSDRGQLTSNWIAKRRQTRSATAAGLSYEVQQGQPGSASVFMQNLIGGSDYAAALGANFSALIASTYGLIPGNKSRRAFWINPGVAWSAPSAAGNALFSLSQVPWHSVIIAGCSMRLHIPRGVPCFPRIFLLHSKETPDT